MDRHVLKEGLSEKEKQFSAAGMLNLNFLIDLCFLCMYFSALKRCFTLQNKHICNTFHAQSIGYQRTSKKTCVGNLKLNK